MKDDLISRKPLIDMLQGVEDNIFAEAMREVNPNKAFVAGVVQEVKNQVLALPGVDAVHVVHGYWLYGDEYAGHHDVDCSVCGESAREYYDYCPNCGAKMDAKEADHG